MRKTSTQKTGPNTPHGKAASSRNSTKHGLLSNPAKLLPGETQEDYNVIRDIWFAEYESDHPGTARLLEALINDDRLVRLSANALMEAHIALHEAQLGPSTDEQTERLHNDLKNKLRYKTNHERSFQRSLRNIEQFGQRRMREANADRRLGILGHKVACETAFLCHKNGVNPDDVLRASVSAPLLPLPTRDRI